jgi:ubiquinone/menaquinone biosynthesis C-methylase UbiE
VTDDRPRDRPDPYRALAPVYDLWAADTAGDVEFYVRRALEAPGPVVELGVGTGRVAIAVAHAGRSVIGVDISPSMLAEGRRRAKATGVADRIAWVQADMRSFVADARVPLVTIPYRSFMHLVTTEDQLACLDAVRRSLAPGGRLVLDLFVPDPALIAAQDRRRHLHAAGVDEGGRQVELWVTPAYEVTTQRLALDVSVETHDGERVVARRETTLELRMVYRYEMEHLLARSGLAVEAVYGDFDERPLAEGCREMIWVARRPG